MRTLSPSNTTSFVVPSFDVTVRLMVCGTRPLS